MLPEGDLRARFQAALDQAWDPTRHTGADRTAVQLCLAHAIVPRVPPREYLGAARAWLDTAAELREEGYTITPRILAGAVEAAARNLVATGMARRILEAYGRAAIVEMVSPPPVRDEKGA